MHFLEQLFPFVAIKGTLDNIIFSSSIVLFEQYKHSLSEMLVLGLVCLPFSIAKVWELHLNFDSAILYLVFFTKYK